MPSGRLACTARLDADGQVEAVRFRNVPSFLLAQDVTVRVGDRLVTLDVAFGGAFYGIVEAASLGLRLAAADLPLLIDLQRDGFAQVRGATVQKREIRRLVQRAQLKHLTRVAEGASGVPIVVMIRQHARAAPAAETRARTPRRSLLHNQRPQARC